MCLAHVAALQASAGPYVTLTLTPECVAQHATLHTSSQTLQSSCASLSGALHASSSSPGPNHTSSSQIRVVRRDALEGKGPRRRPQQRLDRRLEEVAKAVGGGYCRLQMPLKPALCVRETVAGHRLGPLPMHPWSSPSRRHTSSASMRTESKQTASPRGLGGWTYQFSRDSGGTGRCCASGVACVSPDLHCREPRQRHARGRGLGQTKGRGGVAQAKQ